MSSKQKAINFTIVILAIAFIAICAAEFSIMSKSSARGQHAHDNWHRQTGYTSGFKKEDSSHQKCIFGLRETYSFTLNHTYKDKAYTSKKYVCYGGQAIYKNNKQIDIYTNPENPNESCIIRGRAHGYTSASYLRNNMSEYSCLN